MKNRPGQVVIDLDDQLYLLSGRRLRALDGVTELEGDKWVVSDFEGAVPQVMTVDAPLKYVDAVLEKRLREKGALIGGSRVLVFRKRRRGSQATEAYFVSVPAALFASHAAAAEDDECHQLLFAVPGLLSRELDSLRTRKPVAILFAHGRHVDAVVGDHQRTYGAFRASWHPSSSDRSRLVASLANGVRGIAEANNIRLNAVRVHHWLLDDPAEADWADAVAQELGAPRVDAKLERLETDEGNPWSSVPGLLAKLSVADAVSTPAQKGLYLAQAVMPWAAAVLVLISVLALSASAYWSDQARGLTAQSREIEGSLQPPEPPPEVLRAAYEKPLALADTLGRAQLAPTLTSVIAQLSASVSPRITFEEVVVEYPENSAKVLLTLVGRSAGQPDGDGVPEFNAFVAELRKRGYSMVKSELKTDIDAFSFFLQVERGLN